MMKIFTPYIIGYLLLLAVMLTMLIGYEKAELHLLLNAYHTGTMDVFFRYYSLLAELPLYVVALIPLAFKMWRPTCFYALCEVCGAVVVQTLKAFFGAERPMSYFEKLPDVNLPLVDGVSMYYGSSFPSGHTSTFFIFFTFSALLLAHRFHKTHRPERWLQILILLVLLTMAALGGFSRIYLSQHFLVDVCVGSIIGITVPCAVFALYSDKITSR